MNTSDKGIQFIAREEGVRLKLYDDATGKTIDRAADAIGNPTIGVGHLVSKDSITFDGVELGYSAALAILREDIKEAENIITRYVTVKLSQHQFDALISLVFNIGPGVKGRRAGFVWNASGGNSTILRRLNNGDYSAAADAILMWKNAFGKPILLPRRKRERELFLKGVYN